jgi:hypothetical protein
MRSIFRDEFETRSFPRSLAAIRRGFAFYVADPLSSIHATTRNDPTIDSSPRRFVTIRAIKVFVGVVAFATGSAFSNAQESPPPEKARSSISPDKQWEYKLVDGFLPEIVKAGTNEVALNLLVERTCLMRARLR